MRERRTLLGRDARSGAGGAARERQARAGMRRYFEDAAVLARKRPAARAAGTRHAPGDAALRARDPRRLPLRAALGLVSVSPSSACSGWRSSSPRCSGSAARSSPSASRACSTRSSLAPVRPRARSGSRRRIATLAFLAARRGSCALPAFALFFRADRLVDDRRRGRSPTSASARSGRCSGGDGRGGPRARAARCRCSSSRSRSRS